MRTTEERLQIAGPAGPIELIIDHPEAVRGIALVCHPHPLFGGTNTNKVVQTLARTFCQLGYVALRPNFRGVGHSAGLHDDGNGETEDMLAVLTEAARRYGKLPVALAGFSFGAFVQTRVAQRLAESHHPAQQLVLVGTATGHIPGAPRQYTTGTVAKDTLVIHGAADETVPLANVLAWAEPQELPIIVIPGADHFFHRRLHIIRDIVTRCWRH